jgi:hypothetical protein
MITGRTQRVPAHQAKTLMAIGRYGFEAFTRSARPGVPVRMNFRSSCRSGCASRRYKLDAKSLYDEELDDRVAVEGG